MQWQGLLGEFADDGLQGVGVEVARGGAERAERHAWDAQLLLDFVQGAGLLQSTQARERGIEEEEHEQGGVVVAEKAAIAGVVALGADVVQGFQQRLELREILEAVNVLGLYGRFGVLGREVATGVRLSDGRLRASQPPK